MYKQGGKYNMECFAIRKDEGIDRKKVKLIGEVTYKRQYSLIHKSSLQVSKESSLK